MQACSPLFTAWNMQPRGEPQCLLLFGLSVASRMGLYSQVMPMEKCCILAAAPLPSDAWGFTAPSRNSDSEHLQSYYYYLLFAQWCLLIGSTARGVPLCYVQVKKLPCCGFQVCWKSLAESVLPISIAQSTTHIPRHRQESRGSLSHSPTLACRGDSAVLSASTQLTLHPLQVGLFPPRNALSAHFSHIFQVSVVLTQQSAKNLQEEFWNEVQLVLCLLFGV